MNQYSGIGGTLKTIAYVMGILGLIGGIILGNSYANLSLDSLYSLRAHTSFNWIIALVSWVSTGIFCVVLYALGEIAQRQSAIQETLWRLTDVVYSRGVSSPAPSVAATEPSMPIRVADPQVITREAAEPAKPQTVLPAQQAGKGSVVISDAEDK